MSQKTRILSSLQQGKEYTAKQMRTYLGVASPTKVVSRLRHDGHAIYLNKRVDTKGRETMKYRLGTPNRRSVALAMAVVGAAALG
jgi:hypothetical protein